MASSPSSSANISSPPPPPPTAPQDSLIITGEEFKAFHKIDRTLFSRLLFVLSRDISQSLNIMAFLLWLEHCGQARNLVAYVISLPDAFINALADEIAVCLSCMANDDFSLFAANFGDDSNYDVIPLIKRLTKDRLTLKYVHDNRENILRAISKNLIDICIRAFEDICARAQKYDKKKILADERKKMEEEMTRLRVSRVHAVPTANPGSSHGRQGESSEAALQGQVPSDQKSTGEAPGRALKTDGGSSSGGGGSSGGSREGPIPADDRTIFLTFSKGYPISEAEVLTFFTRRFGRVIEAIHMQEVNANEQPLYARMVLHSPYTIPVMLYRRPKNKFTINGKHVWARKYVSKTTPRSPDQSHPMSE